MAPEVRSFPPRPALLAALVLFPLFAAAANPQPAKGPAAANDSVGAKVRLLQELDQQVEAKRRELARQEEALAALRRALEAAKAELVRERDRLELVRAEVEAGLGQKSKASDERLDQIAKIYGAMRPQKAASAIEQLDDRTAASILERLPGRTVGKLFDLMEKNRVRELTRELERRRAPEGGR